MLGSSVPRTTESRYQFLDQIIASQSAHPPSTTIAKSRPYGMRRGRANRTARTSTGSARNMASTHNQTA